MWTPVFAACAAVALAVTAPLAAHADNQALYGTAIPDDAVFVRWLSAPATPQAFGATFPAEAGARTDYTPVSAADLTGAEPGQFYTLIDDAVIAEPARADRAKVYLILLNADDTPARMVLAGQGAEVIGATAQHTAQARGVNPVEATLQILSGDTVLGDFPVALRRGQNLTFVVQDGTATLIENGFAPVADLD